MVDYKRKQWEEAKRKRKAWTGLFGFISLVVFGAFSWVIAPQLRPLIEQNSGIRFPREWPVWASNAVMAFFLFVILFAVAMTLIALFAGPMGDPRDVRTSTGKRRRR